MVSVSILYFDHLILHIKTAFTANTATHQPWRQQTSVVAVTLQLSGTSLTNTSRHVIMCEYIWGWGGHVMSQLAEVLVLV